MDRREVPGEFRVIAYDVPSFRGDYRSMDYGDPNDPRMVALRDEFSLEGVIEAAETEFEGFLALKRWVRSRWDHGYSHQSAEVKDGLDILRQAARGEQFACGHYARTFVDCARALGWPARSIGVSIEHGEFPRDYNVGNTGHSVAEIWSSQYRKWVVMDPDVNVYYRCDDIPLNALEIRDAWLSRQTNQVEMVQDEPLFVVPGERARAELCDQPMYRVWTEAIIARAFERFGRHRVMDYYARVRVNGWEWVDERVLPSLISHFSPHAVKPTSNLDELYWTLNLVRLEATPSWEGRQSKLRISLEHCMPYFDHYQASIDQGEWQRVESSFDWPMHEGVNRLECRAVNVRGRPGLVSRLDVAHAHALEW